MADASASGSDATGGIDARTMLSPDERAKMIARIHSLVYWVGMLIPEEEILGGSEIDLREVVYDLTTKERLTSEDVARVHELIDLLRQREKSLESNLSRDQMTVSTAKEILEEICGILRAIDELRHVHWSMSRFDAAREDFLRGYPGVWNLWCSLADHA